MKKNSRILTLLLALALIFALGAGCNTTTPTETSPDTSPSESTPISPSAQPADPGDTEPVDDGSIQLPITEEDYFYSMWMPVAPFAVGYSSDIENEWTIFREIAARTNIRFNFQAVPAMDEVAQFGVFIAGREYTDIICSAETMYTTGGEGAYDDDVIIDIKDLMYEYVPNLTQWFDVYPDIRASISSDSGRIYSFPQLNHPLGAEATSQVIRQDLLDKYDLVAPETYDEYHDVLTALHREMGGAMSIRNLGDNIFFGYALGISSNFTLGFTGYEYPWYISPDGKEVKCGLLEPEYREYIERFQTWYAEGLIDQDFYSRMTTPTQGAENVTVLNDYFVVWECSAGNISNWVRMADNNPDFKLSPLYFPVQNKGDSKVSHFGDPTNGSPVRKLICAISTVCEDPVPFAKLINYMFSDEGYLLANYGVQGEGFEYVNGEPKLTDLIMDNPEGLGQVVAMHLYTGSVGTLVPYVFDGTRTDTSLDPETLEILNIQRSQYDYSQNYPVYATLTTEESIEYADITQDMTTYLQEHIVALIIGTMSMDEFDSVFVPKIKEFGIERALELKQAAYDRYLARL